MGRRLLQYDHWPVYSRSQSASNIPFFFLAGQGGSGQGGGLRRPAFPSARQRGAHEALFSPLASPARGSSRRELAKLRAAQSSMDPGPRVASTPRQPQPGGAQAGGGRWLLQTEAPCNLKPDHDKAAAPHSGPRILLLVSPPGKGKSRSYSSCVSCVMNSWQMQLVYFSSSFSTCFIPGLN